nr:uncharacterized protein LOC128670873 [Plodia interpunctella]
MIYINYVIVVFSTSIFFVAVANYTSTSIFISTSDSVTESLNRNTTLIKDILIRNETKTRKSFLVVTGKEEVVLRSERKKKRGRPTDRKRAMPTCLYYFELDDEAHKVNEHFMYNLRDVRVFFEEILRTDICYNKCDNLPTPKPSK